MAKRKYTQEFKVQAVELTFTGNKGVRQVAEDLGINANMLDRWRRQYLATDKSNVAFPGNGNSRDEELLNLRKALKQAEMERDILKKAVAFFAQHPQ